MTRPVRLLVTLTVAYGVASLVAGAVLAEVGLRPPRSHTTAAETERAIETAAARGGTLEEVSIEAADGVTLRGWFFPSSDPTKATVLVAHGVTDHRGSALALARLFLNEGYAVLAPDARGHGESGGLASYGVRERDDLRGWVDFLARRRPHTCIVGVGASMGGAELLQAAAQDRRLCGVVAESSFASFREVAFDRIGQRLGTGPWFGRTIGRPAIECGFLYARLRYGLSLTRATPAESVRAIRVPVLLVHGTADRNIPLRHAQLIASANPAVRLWVVSGASHAGAWSAAPDEFPRRLVDFVREVSVPR